MDGGERGRGVGVIKTRKPFYRRGVGILGEKRILKVREVTGSYQTYQLFLTQYQQQQFLSGSACLGSTTLLLLSRQIIAKVKS